MRVGLVPPMILVWRTASNIGPIDQRRGVFRFLHSRDLSMKEFRCDPKVLLHENGSSDMLHIEVGNGNSLNDSKSDRVVIGRKIVERRIIAQKI